jgi:NAD-dependent DNA ligase
MQQDKKNKVTLPYQMWSMDKIKPTSNDLEKWSLKYKGPYILSCKLDGISALYSTESGTPKLYTRGNGIIGQDISHLLPYLSMPTMGANATNTTNEMGATLRGELIIKKATFQEKYSNTFANPRNFVAGLVNSKKPSASLADIDFVIYEVITPILSTSNQFDFLMHHKINIVKYKTLQKISNTILTDHLLNWRAIYEYEIDGIICANDGIYPRTEGNPVHAFAFKMALADQVQKTKVLDVIWTPSKDGYLKPRIQVEPVFLGGVKIEYATGFNAKFILDQKIGPGAVVEIIRSGDVIPHIQSVLIPANKPLFPEDTWEWNETQVDIVLVNKNENETVIEKNLTGFFTGIEVDGLSSGTIRKLISAGYDTIPKIIRMTEQEFMQVPGFKDKLSKKIKDGIETRLKEASLPELMHASNIFGRGFGVKKLSSILDTYPDILDPKNATSTTSIEGLPEKFIEKIKEFQSFMRDINQQYKLNKHKQPTKNPNEVNNELYGKKILMTGFRDKELSQQFEKLGIIQPSSISKQLFILLVKSKEESNIKINEAKKLGIPILTVEEFKQKYNQPLGKVGPNI